MVDTYSLVSLAALAKGIHAYSASWSFELSFRTTGIFSLSCRMDDMSIEQIDHWDDHCYSYLLRRQRNINGNFHHLEDIRTSIDMHSSHAMEISHDFTAAMFEEF